MIVEEQKLNTTLQKMKIDYKFKSEILNKVVRFLNLNTDTKAKNYSRNAKQTMKECNDLLQQCLKEYDEIESTLHSSETSKENKN